MNKDQINLRGGVLIIGSLLWQDYLETPGDNVRLQWRQNHLNLNKKILVRAPIRYGRLSARDNIFTMTFSKSVRANKYGSAYFVPFIGNTPTVADLIREAIALSNAEGMEGDFYTNWGVLGIMINKAKVNKESLRFLLSTWSTEIGKTSFNSKSYKVTANEAPCIKNNGVLNFGWVTPVDTRQTDAFNQYDFLLATATKPTKYPSIKELAESVRADTKRYYWVENFKNGITTFQDNGVLNFKQRSN